ncbi:MAG: Rrf2 family transcriptional regulator [Lachnospiraceae bacterium]|jgi:Rrf2 family protein|nr:Rrf2 family transcriptional regulator [Lachnospiraceae bacterium]
MMISTRGRYALRVMIDLTQQKTGGYIPLKEIAARQEISEKYLESILKLLVKGKILTGLRGKGGGYRLTRAPEEYTVADILELTEETLAPVACLSEDAEPCPRASDCRTLDMWKGLDKLVRDYFAGITLADLAAKNDSV